MLCWFSFDFTVWDCQLISCLWLLLISLFFIHHIPGMLLTSGFSVFILWMFKSIKGSHMESQESCLILCLLLLIAYFGENLSLQKNWKNSAQHSHGSLFTQLSQMYISCFFLIYFCLCLHLMWIHTDNSNSNWAAQDIISCPQPLSAFQNPQVMRKWVSIILNIFTHLLNPAIDGK